MRTKDIILQHIWHFYNQCMLDAQICSSQWDQFWAPIDKDGFQDWLVKLTHWCGFVFKEQWSCSSWQKVSVGCHWKHSSKAKGNCRRRIILAMQFGPSQILGLLQYAHADQWRSLTLASPPSGRTLKLQNSENQRKFQNRISDPKLQFLVQACDSHVSWVHYGCLGNLGNEGVKLWRRSFSLVSVDTRVSRTGIQNLERWRLNNRPDISVVPCCLVHLWRSVEICCGWGQDDCAWGALQIGLVLLLDWRTLLLQHTAFVKS